MNDDAKALAFYQAAFRREAPPYVPARIRLLSDVYGDPPFRGAGASAGEHDCQSNRWGAIAVRDREGKLLGIKPSEYEPIAWRANLAEQNAGGALAPEGKQHDSD